MCLQSADEFEDTREVILEEREEMLADGTSQLTPPGEASSNTKVIDNATNMTEVDMSFEIEEIEVRIAQVCIVRCGLSARYLCP